MKFEKFIYCYQNDNTFYFGVSHVGKTEKHFDILSQYCIPIIEKLAKNNEIVILYEKNLYSWSLEELNFNPYKYTQNVYEMEDHTLFPSSYVVSLCCCFSYLITNTIFDKISYINERSKYMKKCVNEVKLMHKNSLIISIVGARHTNDMYYMNDEEYEHYDIELHKPRKNYKISYFETICIKHTHTILLSIFSITGICIGLLYKYY